MITFLLLFLFIGSICEHTINAEKLSSAKLLLPYHPSIPVHSELEVSETDSSICYKWYSSKPGVVTVDPIGPWQVDGVSCSQRSVVTSKSQTFSRGNAVIFAENILTRQVLKCHVVVEKVTSIMIESKSRELYLEDSPEPFKVLGFDEEGNIFTTLGSLPFEWLLLADDNAAATSTIPSQIIRLVRYVDTSYDAPEAISSLESSGNRGYSVLLEGLQTGVAFISAKIKDSFYKDVAETHVKVRVVANVQLLPGEVYLMPLATSSINAFMFRQNRPHPLQLPSNQYSAAVGDIKIASFDEKASLVKALGFGNTNVTLIDKNIQVKDDYIPPSSFIFVEKPVSLRMTILQYPHASSPWVLESDRSYNILVEVLDRLGHVLTLPEDFVIKAVFSPDIFEVLSKSNNGTIWNVKTKVNRFGEGTIPASATWQFKSFQTKLEISQDFVIYSRIVVHPGRFALPLAIFGPETVVGYHLNVSGGSGQYIFMSSDNKVVNVDSSGFVRSVALEPSSAEIKVIDQRNHKHTAKSIVFVGDIIEMEFSPDSKVEALVNNFLNVGIRAYILRGHEKIPLANCSVLKLSLELTRMHLQESGDVDKQKDIFKIVEVASPHIIAVSDGLDCANVVLDTIRSGFSELKLRSPLPASIVISGYLPLTLDLNTDYGVEEAVTAIHTKVRLPVVGGPLAWPGDRESHLVKVEEIGKNQIDFAFSFTWNSRHVEILAECSKYGEYFIDLTVGNVRSTEKNSVFEKLKLKVICPEPDHIKLSIPWGQDSSQGSPCPAALDNTLPFPVVTGEIFPVEVLIFDDKNRAFIDISSFSLKWAFDQNLISCAVSDCVDLRFQKDHKGHLVSFKTSSQVGNDGLSVELIGYRKGAKENLKKMGSIFSKLDFKVVNKARLSMANIVLFTIPAATTKLQVLDGSGFFQFNILDRGYVNERIASTIQSDFQTLGINPRGNGIFNVEASDLCSRPGSNQAELTAEVKVLSIDKLTVVSRRFIAVGETHNIGVIAMDATEKYRLPAELYDSINLQPVYAEDKISIVHTSFANDIAIFTVTGKSSGLAKLSFTASSVASRILSSATDYAIEVCQPVTIDPSPKLVLMDGAQYQLAIVGGPLTISPKPQITFRFLGESSDSVTLDKSSGVVHGMKLGDSQIEAVLYDQDPLKKLLGKNSVVEILTPSLSVEVRHLNGIHLGTPSNLVEAGSLIPVTIFGIKDVDHKTTKNYDFSPAGFGTAEPPLSFSWSVTPAGPKVALLSPFFGALYSRPLDADFTVYFKAELPGDFVVTAYVSRPGEPNFRNLTASITISAALPFKIGRVHNPFVVTVGSELHLPHSGNCPFGSPRYTQLSESTCKDVCKNASCSDSTPVLLGPSDSFVGKAPGQTTYLAKCSSSDFLSLSFDVKPHFSYTVIQYRGSNKTDSYQSNMLGLPYGASIKFDLDYFTQHGRRFDAVSGQLNCRLNRRDALTFYLSSGTPRSVSVDLSLANSVSVVACRSSQSFPLYLSLVIKEAVSPYGSSVNVGDVVCFRHAFDDGNEKAQWKSSEASNLFVDNQSGVAVALNPSKRESVSVDFGAGMRAATYLSIRPISQLEFMNTESRVISNTKSNSSLGFDLLVESASHQTPRMWGQCPVNFYPPLLQAQFPIPIQCEMSAPERYHRLFSVSTTFDTASSPPFVNYRCHVRFLGVDNDKLRDIGLRSASDFSVQEFPLRIYASLSSGQQSQRASTEIQFVPNVYLSSDQLLLNGQYMSANLTIAATDIVFRSVVVQPSHSSFISVTGPNPVTGQQSRYFYEISVAAHRKVPINLLEKLYLIVKVPMFNHEQKVGLVLPDNYVSGQREDVSSEKTLIERIFGSNYSPTMVLAYLIAAVLLILLILQLSYRNTYFQQPNFVRTVYSYEDSPRTPPTPPLRRSQNPSPSSADLDAQLLTAFRASSRSPIRPPASNTSFHGGLNASGGPSSSNRLWSTGYVPEGNLSSSFASPYQENQR